MSDYNDSIIPEPCLRLDYGFGQEYASVELGDGTGYVRVTDELRGEYYKMQRWYEDELKAALDENAKLRELVRVMAYCNQFRRDCDGCSMNGAAGIITERAGCDELLARLRELGIEVE